MTHRQTPSPALPSVAILPSDDHAGVCSVFRTLLYYHIFDFPLRKEELFGLTDRRWRDQAELDAAIEGLADLGLLNLVDGYCVVGDPAAIERRCQAERRAHQVMPVARRRARLIARFPWVRSVSISGTLSKAIFQRHDDVDYFVITDPGRLWLCRLALMAFKKVFLLNSRKFFCINYLIATNRLTVPDHNLFTAMEFAWLCPVVDDGSYGDLLDANRWIGNYLPNWTPPVVAPERASTRSLAPKVERIFAGAHGDTLDEYSRRLFRWRNHKRYAALGPQRLNQALRAEPEVAKHHPRDSQRTILARHAELLREAQDRCGLPLCEATFR